MDIYHIKIHEFKNIITQGYCYGFQTGKCKFGEKCEYKREINPDNKKTTPIIDKSSLIITTKINKIKIIKELSH